MSRGATGKRERSAPKSRRARKSSGEPAHVVEIARPTSPAETRRVFGIGPRRSKQVQELVDQVTH